jgi:hypothetical protein
MSAPGTRALLLVGALGVLTVGAIALSLATAPPVAEQQLHIGASATAGVGSFVMDLTNTVTTKATLPGRAAQVQRSSVHFVYQAPDRIDETLVNATGRAVEIVCVGNSRYERTTGGHWVQLPAGANGAVSACQSAVSSVVLVPANAAAVGTPVVRHGQTSNAAYTYDLTPADLATVLRVMFGVGPSVIAGHHFTAAIDKEYMVSQAFLAAAGNQTDLIGVRYSQLGTAPAVVPPSAGALRAG